MKQEFRRGQVTLRPGQAVEISDTSAGDEVMSEDDKQLVSAVGAFIFGYLKVGKELLETEFQGVAELAPPRFAEKTRVLIFLCIDGVLVRYETATESATHAMAYVASRVAEAAPDLSERVLVCTPEDPSAAEMANDGPTITLTSWNAATGLRTTLFEAHIQYRIKQADLVISDESATEGPRRLIGVERDFEFDLQGVLQSVGDSAVPDRGFLATTNIALPVGWQYLEIYARGSVADWDVQQARALAERDILGYVMRRQLRASGLRALDPNVDARREWVAVLDEFTSLLDGDPSEEDIQQFLKSHPSLLSPTHSKVWPKLPIGARVTDFVFREADGEYLLVELERSSDRLFRKDGDATAKVNHARDQIVDWKRYIADNLSTVRGELGLEGITSDVKGLVVIGRSDSLSTQNRAKLAAINAEQPRLRIVTYDDVLANAKAAIENILGPLWAASGSAEIYMLKSDGGL